MPGWLIGAGTFFCFHHLGAYVVSPLGQVWTQGFVNRRYIEGFEMAQWGAALGLATWSVVYPWVFRASFPTGAREGTAQTTSATPTRTLYIYTILATIISVIIWVCLDRLGMSKIEAGRAQVSQMNASLVLGFQFITYVTCSLLAYFAFRSRAWLALWSLSVGAFVTWHLLDGSRAPVIMAACFSACGFYYAGMRLRTVALSASTVAILLVPTFSVVRIYRDANIGAGQSVLDRMHGFQEAITYFAATSGDTDGGASSVFFDRLSPDPVDYIFLKTPQEIPYAGLSGMSRVLYMFVPQTLLPDRPDLIDGNEVAIEYGAGRAGSTGNSLSVVADGYRRFGWPGIVMLYALIAACAAFVSAKAWGHRNRLEWLSSLIVLLVCLNGENTLSTLVSTFYYVIWIFPKYFLFFLALRIVSELFAGKKHSPRSHIRLAIQPVGVG
jgi:hypothetical protein